MIGDAFNIYHLFLIGRKGKSFNASLGVGELLSVLSISCHYPNLTITEKGYTLSSSDPYSITLILVVHCKLALVLSVGVLDKEHGMAFIFFYTIIRNLINY